MGRSNLKAAVERIPQSKMGAILERMMLEGVLEGTGPFAGPPLTAEPLGVSPLAQLGGKS